MKRSRSLLERLSTLTVAVGLALVTSIGSVHDPSCSHHRAEEADGRATHAPDAAPSHAGHAGHATDAQQQSGEDTDCTCPGGRCVLSGAAPLPSTASAEWSSDFVARGEVPAVAISSALGLPEHAQPPGTGPPTPA